MMAAMNWDLSTVADRIGQVIASAEADLRLEQAVYGLDTRDEKQFHEILAAGLKQYFGVTREVHYPSTAGRKLTHRQRCDLVLTPLGRELKLDSAPATLFDPPDACLPGEALWIEVKTAYQFREGGARHGGYGPQWRQGVVDDLRKMESEPLIKEAALLLIVFNESQEILEKDLRLFENLLVEKEVLAGFHQVRSVGILERIGHRFCTAGLWPTLQR
jgi:hypothetical protein